MTDQVDKVATEDVTLVIVDEELVTKDAAVEIASAKEAATAQALEQLITITNTTEAVNLLKLGDSYDVPTMLTAFEKEIHASIDNRKTRMLKPLTEAKNILLRLEIEKMIEANGRFDLEGMIPYEEACISCHGSGELYKFFRKAATVPCKFCTDGKPEDNGYVFITCRACKGTKRYKKTQKDLKINVACTRCYKDPDTGEATGLERVKCRACLGKATFRKLVIDAKIKSTTHCRHCKGRGFVLPEPPAKKVKAAPEKYHDATPENPVISADLGEALKGADVKE